GPWQYGHGPLLCPRRAETGVHMAVELGAAYISILPSTSKLAPELYKSINKTVPKVGNQAGQTMGSRMAAAAGRALKAGAVVGVAAAGAAIGAALVGGFRSAIDQ